MDRKHFFNRMGMAKVCHEPDPNVSATDRPYVIYVLPHMDWEPVRLHLRFPTHGSAVDYLVAVYDKVEHVAEDKFNALCANLRVLPKNFSNCR